ncbi:MAG: hypothetical protein CVU06_14340, partial [Bacteroidetes bacterium HGW-Bacteroidetes-22]
MRIKLLILSISVLVLLQSCETDFELNSSWKDIPIVYGILNPGSKTQNIRIQRAFLGDGNAMTFAQVVDSNYYDTAFIRAKIIEMNESTVVRTIKLKPVWVHRDSLEQTTFYNPSFPYALIYKTESYSYYEVDEITGDTIWLNPSHTFKIEITNSRTGKIITSSTPLVGRVSLKLPNFNLSNPQLSINPTAYNVIKWTKTGSGARYESILRFYYKEYHPGMNDTTLNFVDMNFGYLSGPTSGSDFVVKYYGENYYKLLGTKIPADHTVKRIAYRFNIFLNIIEEELNEDLEFDLKDIPKPKEI